MAFWGAVVKPGKPHAFVPPPEEWNLHLSQAALAPTVPEGQRVALAVTSDSKDEPLIICTLTAGRIDTAALDLFFSQYTEFSVVGGHALYLSGYYSPSQIIDDDDEEEEDEDYEPGALGFPMHDGQDLELEDDDDEDDEDEDDEDEDDDDLDGLDEDEDEDEDDDDYGVMDVDGDGGEMFGYEAMLRAKRKTHVVIEDITDQGQEQQPSAGKKADKKAGKKAKSAPESHEDEEEEEDEEEDATPAKVGKSAAPAAAKRTANGTPSDNGPAKRQAVGQQQQPIAKRKETTTTQAAAEPTKSEAKTQVKAEVVKPREAKPQKKQQQEEVKQEAKPAKKNVRRHPNGFEVEDVSFGNAQGKLAKPGHKVHVRYTGRLKSNGKVFDKSTGKPFAFRLGVGEVIKGWDLGVEGMRVGDKRRLVIPPQLAYGTSGVKGTIPSNATLEFDVELVDVK